ncbi:hypothetical protein HDU97_009328 [Phlyctochytrium planicorne]|nr:hypothetical protein HDU97_009328 [Phlyctochytrium planicorne]
MTDINDEESPISKTEAILEIRNDAKTPDHFNFFSFVQIQLRMFLDAVLVSAMVLPCVWGMGLVFEAVGTSVPDSGYSVMPAMVGILASEAAVFLATSKSAKMPTTNTINQLPSFFIVTVGNMICLVITIKIWYDGTALRQSFLVSNTVVHILGFFAWKHYCRIRTALPPGIEQLPLWKQNMIKIHSATVEVIGSIFIMVLSKYLISALVMLEFRINNGFVSFFYQGFFLVMVAVTAKLDQKYNVDAQLFFDANRIGRNMSVGDMVNYSRVAQLMRSSSERFWPLLFLSLFAQKAVPRYAAYRTAKLELQKVIPSVTLPSPEAELPKLSEPVIPEPLLLSPKTNKEATLKKSLRNIVAPIQNLVFDINSPEITIFDVMRREQSFLDSICVLVTCGTYILLPKDFLACKDCDSAFGDREYTTVYSGVSEGPWLPIVFMAVASLATNFILELVFCLLEHSKDRGEEIKRKLPFYRQEDGEPGLSPHIFDRNVFSKVQFRILIDALIVSIPVVVFITAMAAIFDAAESYLPPSGYPVLPALASSLALEVFMFFANADAEIKTANFWVHLPSSLVVVGGNLVCALNVMKLLMSVFLGVIAKYALSFSAMIMNRFNSAYVSMLSQSALLALTIVASKLDEQFLQLQDSFFAAARMLRNLVIGIMINYSRNMDCLRNILAYVADIPIHPKNAPEIRRLSFHETEAPKSGRRNSCRRSSTIPAPNEAIERTETQKAAPATHMRGIEQMIYDIATPVATAFDVVRREQAFADSVCVLIACGVFILLPRHYLNCTDCDVAYIPRFEKANGFGMYAISKLYVKDYIAIAATALETMCWILAAAQGLFLLGVLA